MPLPTFNLVTDPWVECFDIHGKPVTLGLGELVERSSTLVLAEHDPLLRPAIWRLLAAVCYAADAYPADEDIYVEQIRHGVATDQAAEYLRCHVDEFNLFDRARPFGQDAALQCAVGTESVSPAIYLDVRAAVDRPLLADHRHLAGAAPLTVVQALRALLIQNLWGFGGRTRGKSKHFGPGGSNYGLASLVNGRIVLSPEAATVGKSLAWRLIPTADAGQPLWTYPTDPPTSAARVAGEAAGLTWPTRRVLLIPDSDGNVDGVAIARGLRYLEPAPHEPATGWSDIVTTAKMPLSGKAPTSADDLLPIVAAFPNARKESLLWYATRAAHTVDHIPPFRAYSLVAATRGQKKAEVARAITIPPGAITRTRAPELASTLLATRRIAKVQPVADDVPTYLAWLSDKDNNPNKLLTTVRDHVTNTLLREIITDPAKTAQRLIAVHNLITEAETTSMDTDDDPAPLSFSDDLFTTVDTTSAAARKPRPTPDTDPATVLLSRLSGYLKHRAHAGTLNQIADYVIRPDLSNPGIAMVSRGLPTDQLEAAAAVAGLFAFRHRGHRFPLTGTRPLARVARSFGGTTRGPANTQIRVIVDRVVKARPDRLLTEVAPLVRMMRSMGDARIDWTDLYRDFVYWGERDTRRPIRWALLFTRTDKVESIDHLLNVKGTP